MSLPLQADQSYLSRVRGLASTSGFEDVVVALSKPENNSTKSCLMIEDRSSAQALPISTPAEILTTITKNQLHLRETICVVENISPEHIEVLGSAWDIDPSFFVEHAVNPRREDLWDPRRSEPEAREQTFDCLDGNFEYHGLNVRSDEELNSLPNYFERHCFRSTWEGVETITSNTRTSYYRVNESLHLFLVDAPLEIQKRYDGMPRQLRPSLRLPYASNRGGLQLQPLYELRDKKGVYYSLYECLKSMFLHGWQRYLLFNYFCRQDAGGVEVLRRAVLPASPLCYLLSNSISRTNLRYLSQEIRRISFQEIRDPNQNINETLHDRREDLVAFMKAGLIETITYVPANVDRHIEPVRDQFWPNEDPTQRSTTSAHRKTLEEALELERFLMETFQLLMSSISVQDAKLSVKQGQLSNRQSLRATQLTILASIYVPLSFVTGIFGMNLKELNGSSLSIWIFFVAVVIAAAVTAIIFLILQWHSKGTRTKNDVGKIGRNDEAVGGAGCTSKLRGMVFGSNRTVEKSMA